jgi:hypothetical protein
MVSLMSLVHRGLRSRVGRWTQVFHPRCNVGAAAQSGFCWGAAGSQRGDFAGSGTEREWVPFSSGLAPFLLTFASDSGFICICWTNCCADDNATVAAQVAAHELLSCFLKIQP